MPRSLCPEACARSRTRKWRIELSREWAERALFVDSIRPEGVKNDAGRRHGPGCARRGELQASIVSGAVQFVSRPRPTARRSWNALPRRYVPRALRSCLTAGRRHSRTSRGYTTKRRDCRRSPASIVSGAFPADYCAVCVPRGHASEACIDRIPRGALRSSMARRKGAPRANRYLR